MIFRSARFPAMVGAFSLAAAAPGALAYIQPAASAPGSSNTAYQESQQAVELSPIVVNGQHMPFPIALQMIKKAISRPWSSARADRDKMVCRFEDMQGSYLQTLHCETNAQHEKLREATQYGLFMATTVRNPACNLYCVLAHGMTTLPVLEYVNDHWINRGALMSLLKKLPPADSSYTLRITDHGKPIADYVIENGELVKIHVFKKDASKNGG